jgi:hypothetical protein
LISALMRAFSPTVRAPSEEMLPSILPSTTRSFENLMLPLISTSVLRTLRPLGAALFERAGGLLVLMMRHLGLFLQGRRRLKKCHCLVFVLLLFETR